MKPIDAESFGLQQEAESGDFTPGYKDDGGAGRSSPLCFSPLPFHFSFTHTVKSLTLLLDGGSVSSLSALFDGRVAVKNLFISDLR